jgi:hypothetical protein
MWSRRDSNPRPDTETVMLSTCLSAIRLSGGEQVSRQRTSHRSYCVLFLRHNPQKPALHDDAPVGNQTEPQVSGTQAAN